MGLRALQLDGTYQQAMNKVGAVATTHDPTTKVILVTVSGPAMIGPRYSRANSVPITPATI